MREKNQFIATVKGREQNGRHTFHQIKCKKENKEEEAMIYNQFAGLKSE